MEVVDFLFFVTATLLLIQPTVTDDECKSRLIYIRGFATSLTAPVFATAGPIYESERAKIGRQVVLSMKSAGSLNLRNVLTSAAAKASAITFSTINGNTRSNSANEIRIPMTASALVIIYNLPEYDQLQLSIPNIAGIYRGSNTLWNTSLIAKNNPNVTLPFKRILPIARADNDPSTVLFTQVLSANVPDWKDKYGVIYDPGFVNDTCCNSTKWPQDVVYMYANQTVGMVGVVASIPYTVGYATLPSLSQFSVNHAKIFSRIVNKTVEPTVQSIQTAIHENFVGSQPNDLLLNVEAANNSEAYPMWVFNSIVFNLSYTSDMDCCAVQEMVGFFDWFFFEYDEIDMIELNFVPLMPELKERIRRLAIEKIQCNGELMYAKYKASQVVSTSMELGALHVAIISSVTCATVVLFGFVFYYCMRKHQSDESRWFIHKTRVTVELSAANELFKQIKPSRMKPLSVQGLLDTLKTLDKIDEASMDSDLSRIIGDGEFASEKQYLKETMIVAELDQRKVFLHKLDCNAPQSWCKATKRWLSKMRSFNARNVSAFLGIVELNNRACAIFEFCSKGTLHYVLTNTTYSITESIKYQLAIDVAQGMKYLNDMGVTHGRLSSLTCYLDSTWTGKISQYEQIVLYLNEKPTQMIEITTYHLNQPVTDQQLIEMIYVDPTLRRRRDSSVDAYSFGMLLIEIFTQKIPFAIEVEEGSISYDELLKQKFHRSFNVTPKIKNVPPTVGAMSKVCMGVENNRPTFQALNTQLKKAIKISTGIVDIIMDTLEQHAKMLEEKVEERTSELKSVTNKMRILLYEVLPPQIADKLFSGQPVQPEYYECVTIYFSDIVGFTDISARSKPIDVMTFLNDLWMAFDSIIDKFDVYKVDTIGDAYMVASGLPMRNGVNHSKEIAHLALALLDRCSKFKIQHLPNEILKIRIGINSGPVTAGVVGFKMPQYCVFGDTVNTASRMESTSEAQRIQVSDRTYNLIMSHFADSFTFVHRGDVEVKGKGFMKTYWLIE